MSNEKDGTHPDGYRIHEPKEKLEGFRGHRGTCVHCKNPVIMHRNSTFPYAIRPDFCNCLACGQTYFVETDLPLLEFEYLQWKQKNEGDIGWNAESEQLFCVKEDSHG